MLRAVEFPLFARGTHWSLCPYSGNLLAHNRPPKLKNSQDMPDHVRSALKLCDNPFLLPGYPGYDKNCNAGNSSFRAKNICRIMGILSSNKMFFALRLYAGIHRGVFIRSSDAFRWLNKNTALSPEEDCLQRCMFVAKTSLTFRASGVIFIGAFVPTTQMHAWVIDGGSQPDPQDRGWINYTPLLALYAESK